MVVDFAFICDYADVQSAKINALGIGFDTIFAPELPAAHPFFSLIARLRASIAEAGSKSLVVRLIDADGQDIISPIEGSFEMPRPELGGESIGRIGINFANVTFPRYGSYSLHVVIQGTEMVRIPLRVAPPPTTG